MWRCGNVLVDGVQSNVQVINMNNDREDSTFSLESRFEFMQQQLEHARARLHQTGVQKWVVVMNLSRFSLFNAPPLSVSKQSVVLLMSRFPEHLGHCIVWQPPLVFSGLWHACKYLLDANTMKKIVFVSGDHHAGSEVDVTMTRIIGPRWRDLIDVDYATPGRSVYDAHAAQERCQQDAAYVRHLSTTA
jgi:hypothetical protein